ncbi:unnamed protein product [Candidula unifasciata]|uniref:B30.2/SPRY domain-containing protein n=1 Tax=Candidula unifasciata TaxID=100452 RepID=A0A8S3YZ50_9EUPU|nr:unnamed protein product [Candidula unifasciata]
MNRYGAGLTPVAPQQFMAAPRSTGPYSGMSDYSRQSAAPLPGVQSNQSSYRGPSNNQDFRQRDDDRRFAGRRPGNRFQADTEPELDEPNLDESLVVLDHFNSDLHLVIDPDGYGASVLNDPPGFCFTWAGARATYGACRGKVFYEVHVVEHLPADFGDDHNETDPHIVRLGWSTDSSSFQLGEEPWSYGYGGTGKFSTNNRFTDYGGRFEEGDVIGAMLDLESRPPTISYMKNGTWLGVAAPLHGIQVGSKEKALFPHVLSKNCRFKVNFGQMDAWYPPPMGFRYLGQLPLVDRVRGMVPPARKSDCEMIMIVGLPGAGKTTWGINMEKNHPEKRYNIIGTDTLIEKMRVMGLPRKRNYHGRWEVLIGKATTCLNKLFAIAAKRRRNYILDQTNVYATARRRKMRNFAGFYKIAAVIQPDDPELERRSYKRTHVDGKVVPESAVLEMKANYSIPEDRDNLFDRIDFVELKRDTVQQLVRIYNDEGKTKPRDDNSQNRFDSDRKLGMLDFGGGDRTRPDAGYGGGDRTRPDAGYDGGDRTRLDAGYGGGDRTRLDAGYGGGDRTRPDAGYGGGDRTRPDAGYGGGDRTHTVAGYGSNDRTRPDAGYGGSDRTRPDAGYGGNDRTHLDAGYGGNDRTRPDAGYGGNDRTRPDAGYGGNDRTLPDAGYGINDRTRPDAGYVDYDRARQGGAYSNADRIPQDRFGSNDRIRQRGEYTQDSPASRSNQGYGAGSTSVPQNYDADARKSGNQSGYTSRWGPPGQDRAAFSDQIKQEVDVDAFSSSQKTSSQSTEGSRRPSRFSAASHTDLPKALPSNTGNIKTEVPAAVKDSPIPDIRKSSSISVLGQPGLKPLIPALERKESDQIRKEKPAVEIAPSQPKGSTSSTNSAKRAVPPDNVEGRLTGISEDKKPKPLASTEEKKPELPTAASTSSSKGGISSTPSKEGPDKAELLPASDTSAAAKDPWNGPANKPRGAPWQPDRFPGPREDMEARRLPRGPAHYGSFGGPPRGPMGGPSHGFRGPGPWNQNHPRFGPQGLPRPFFSGPPGRWPRPPR